MVKSGSVTLAIGFADVEAEAPALELRRDALVRQRDALARRAKSAQTLQALRAQENALELERKTNEMLRQINASGKR